MIMKKAIVTGINGQDGAYLSKLLIDKGYEVYGALRRSSERSSFRNKLINTDHLIKYIDFELSEYSQIQNTIKEIKPDLFFNLAAMSFVGTSFDQPLYTHEVNALGAIRILESIRHFSPNTKFYQASTSEMFGLVQEVPQSEATPFYPRSPYGVAKLSAHWQVINYRESFGLFASNGILFNHESPLRGDEFVTKKIVKALNKIKNNEQEFLVLGNLNAQRDWGYAGDYVEAMYRIITHSKPDDFVVGTGETHSVREFVDIASSYYGFNIEWLGENENEVGIDKDTGKQIVKVSPDFYRPAEVDLLISDPSKIKNELGWKSETSFENLVEMMARFEKNKSL
jgi:GDPmannose 4,6-dehydratase